MKLRISIRYKMLLVMSAVLLLAVGMFLFLATTLFSRDKLIYIYDLNAALVETLSEQTRSNLSVLSRELDLCMREVLQPEISTLEDSQSATALFAHEDDVLRVEIFRRAEGEEARYVREHAFVNQALADRLGLGSDDLDRIRRERPLPFQALVAEQGRVHLQNSSLPPDAALLTLSVAHSFRSRSVVLAVDFSHERLLRIFGRSRLHETYLVDERGEILAHPDSAKVISHFDASGHALVREALVAGVDRGVREFTGEGGASFLGAYARVGIGRLSVLTQIPKEEALKASRDLIRRSVLFAAAILLAAFVVSVFFSRLLTAPVRRLRTATEVIGSGRFDIDVTVSSRDEIGDLARSFEQMVTALKETQAQLIRSERLAAFGQLGAAITHEVKNPMTSIIGFAQLAQVTKGDPEKVLEMLKIIEKEGLRCQDILVNFLKFARHQDKKFEDLDLNELVKETTKIIKHQLMIHKVKLDVELGDDVPRVSGNAGDLQQVVLNLALNAQEAMPGGGTVRLSTRRDGDAGAVIAIADDGPGIPENIRQKVFEPFFTTKPPGQGTGLGLSITSGIVRDHQGSISLESEVGKGTTFTIRLPARRTTVEQSGAG